MSTYTLKEAASLKNPEAWIALMQIEYKCDHEKPQNFNKVQIHQLKHTRWKTEIADCKKKIQYSHCQVSSFWKTRKPHNGNWMKGAVMICPEALNVVLLD